MRFSLPEQNNADNEAADLSLLLELKGRQTLQKLQERTEKEKDKQRAACNRLREEATVRECVGRAKQTDSVLNASNEACCRRGRYSKHAAGCCSIDENIKECDR